MSETLTVMSTITGQNSYLRRVLRLPVLGWKESNRCALLHACVCRRRTAQLFDKDDFFHPLARGQDVLVNRHSNTHLAQVTISGVVKKPVWVRGRVIHDPVAGKWLRGPLPAHTR